MMRLWQPLLSATLLLLIQSVAANLVVLCDNATKCTFPSLGSAFGRQLHPDNKIRGYMLLADPIDACTRIKAAPKPSLIPVQLPWFVLISRSEPGIRSCPFDVKIYNAQKAGYAAAVVHNLPGHNDIFPMHAEGKLNITIPSQFIGYRDSLSLSSYIRSNDIFHFKYVFELNGEEPSLPEPYYYIIPFFVVVCIIVIILVVALVVKLCREYFHSRRSRLSKRHLKKLPTKKFAKNADPFETCAICLDDFEEGDKIRILPCNHAYHCLCIDPWLLKQKRCCPVCKRKIRFGRRRRDPPTAAPDSSDSEGGTTTGDERTPLLGSNEAAPAARSLTSSGGTIGVINGDITEEPSTSGVVDSVQTDASSSRFARFVAALLPQRWPWRRGYEEDGVPVLGAVGPAGYGSFDPPATPANSTANSSSPSHVVEVHAPADVRGHGVNDEHSQQPPEVV